MKTIELPISNHMTYAGIGSRSITEKETETILKVADSLSKKFILFSGNSEGSDIAFEREIGRAHV